jgi:hypothetical protein
MYVCIYLYIQRTHKYMRVCSILQSSSLPVSPLPTHHSSDSPHFIFMSHCCYYSQCHHFRSRFHKWSKAWKICLFKLAYLAQHDVLQFHPFSCKFKIIPFLFMSNILYHVSIYMYIYVTFSSFIGFWVPWLIPIWLFCTEVQ